MLLSYQEQLNPLSLIIGYSGNQVTWQVGSNPYILQAGKQITRADLGCLEGFFLMSAKTQTFDLADTCTLMPHPLTHAKENKGIRGVLNTREWKIWVR